MKNRNWVDELIQSEEREGWEKLLIEDAGWRDADHVRRGHAAAMRGVGGEALAAEYWRAHQRKPAS